MLIAAPNIHKCASYVLTGIEAISAQNEPLFVSKSREGRAERVFGLGTGVQVTWAGAFPPRGLSAPGQPGQGRPAGAAAAAGLRPVLDLAARSHGMAAARERKQQRS
jgi:hypothetical protein